MAEDKPKPRQSDKDTQILNTIRESSAIDFDRLGKLVARVGPQIFSGQLARGDYFISIFTSFIRIIKLGFAEIIDIISDLRDAGTELRK